ncbi:DRTGG domain-containing protein [Congzhengia sp.]|uniref:DRTGG domain-containing protein n=1 Tax=Congzhengia sp. TaxID=2944168 RepID=UPI003077BD76
MLVSELKEKLGLEAANMGDTDKEAAGCYIGDMLSVVMSRANEGDVWLTVQTNVNIDAVAVLTGAACIVVVEGMEPDKDTIEKAKMQDVTVLKSSDTAYELACKICNLI